MDITCKMKENERARAPQVFEELKREKYICGCRKVSMPFKNRCKKENKKETSSAMFQKRRKRKCKQTCCKSYSHGLVMRQRGNQPSQWVDVTEEEKITGE